MNVHVVFVLLLAVSALTTSEGAISVVNKTPRDGTIVKEGRPVRLSCRTNSRDVYRIQRWSLT